MLYYAQMQLHQYNIIKQYKLYTTEARVIRSKSFFVEEPQSWLRLYSWWWKVSDTCVCLLNYDCVMCTVSTPLTVTTHCHIHNMLLLSHNPDTAYDLPWVNGLSPDQTVWILMGDINRDKHWEIVLVGWNWIRCAVPVYTYTTLVEIYLAGTYFSYRYVSCTVKCHSHNN